MGCSKNTSKYLLKKLTSKWEKKTQKVKVGEVSSSAHQTKEETRYSYSSVGIKRKRESKTLTKGVNFIIETQLHKSRLPSLPSS